MGWSVLGDEPLASPARWEPPPGERGSYQILSSCVLTLVLCVWTAMHLNIPATRKRKRPKREKNNPKEHPIPKSDKSGLSTNWKKVKWVIIALIMPETVTAIAFTQWIEQRSLLKFINEKTELGIKQRHKIRDAEMNEIDIASVNPGPSPAINADNGFNSEIPSEEAAAENIEASARQKAGPPIWTRTHAWYALMGGFVIENQESEDFQFPFPNGLTRLTLTTDAVRVLALEHPYVFPAIRASEIIDKSKSNGLAKAIVCFQATWFCVYVVGRIAQSLPLTVLELNTAAHCICTLLCYMCWWNKPLDISEPVLISLREPEVRRKVAQMCIESNVGHYAEREETAYSGVASLRGDWDNLVDRLLSANTRSISGTASKVLVNSATRASGCLVVDEARARLQSRVIRVHDARLLAHQGPTLTTRMDGSFTHLARVKSLDTLLELHYLADLRPQSSVVGRPYLQKYSVTMSEYSKDWLALTAVNSPLTADYLADSPLGPFTLIFVTACSIYAGLHATAWNGPFGSRAEKYLWRAGVLSFCPLLLELWIMLLLFKYDTVMSFLGSIKDRLMRKSHGSNTSSPVRFLYRVLFHVFEFLCWAGGLPSRIDGFEEVIGVVGIFLYGPLAIIAFLTGRTFLVVEAFLALPHAPDSVFVQPNWSTYFPHFA